MVWLHRDHCRRRTGSRGLAGTTRLLAVGILHQSPAGCSRYFHFSVVDSGYSKCGSRARGLLGAILATVGLAGLVGGFIQSVSSGWKNPLVLGGLVVGVGCLIALLFFEAKIADPMLPVSLFQSRSFSGANLLTLFLYSAIGIFFFLFPMNLIQVQGYTTTATGAALLPLILLIFVLSRWSGGLVARYGPRNPLIIGPVIAALGFILFARPLMGSGYWMSFFPAVIVLGFGMAVSVAPLTTVVMNSVSRNRIGAASGINNAVARVAGVLAIAVLGVVMVNTFSSRLNHELGGLSLPSVVLEQVHSDEIKLAGMHVPDGLDPSTQAAIKRSVGAASVFGFRTVMLICAALAAASAVVAWLMIPNDKDRQKAPVPG
jgi:hypothetical protein